MARLAWLGLGQMGAPMARRMVEAGHDVVAWNRSEGRDSELVEAGAERAPTPRDAVATTDVTLTMLATPTAVMDVLFGENGAAAALAGKTLIEMSTVGTDLVLEVAAKLPEAAVMIDAPVLGSVPQATDGSLKIFVGSDEETFEDHVDLLSALGTPIHLGPLGAGASMKLVVNSTLGAVMSAAGEALALADVLGLDHDKVVDVLKGSPVGPTIERKLDLIESDSYPPNFKLELALKDLDLVVAAAEARGLELRIAAGAKEWYAQAEGEGLGSLDYSAVVSTIRRRPASL